MTDAPRRRARLQGRRAAATVLAACALAWLAPPARAQFVPDAEPVQTRTLANGLTVIVIEDDAVAVAHTAMWYRVGASDEPPEKTGSTHALARMLFRGTPSLSAAGFDDVVARLAARADVTTANDYTRYALTVPADQLELALRIEADRMQHASLSDAAWNAEKRSIAGQNGAALEQPLGLLYREVCRAASATPLCATAAFGESDDVASLTTNDLRATYRASYGARNATLVIAGDVRAQSAFARAESAFGAIPASGPPLRTGAAPRYAHDAQVEVRGRIPYEVIDFAYPAPAANDPQAGAFSILDGVLGDKRSEVSRALLDSGYAAEFTTRLDRNVRGSLYHVFVTVARNHTSAPARAAFLDAIARTCDRGISEELVFAAKATLVRSAEDAGDSIVGIAEHVGYAIAVENVAGPGIDAQRVRSATLADVVATARAFLREPAATGILGAGSSRDDALPPPPAASVTDDFSHRPPVGKVVEAPWVRRALAKPESLASGLSPDAFALASGLRVLVQPVHANPTVFVSGTVESSPRFDAPRREGTGSMVSSLLAYGGAKYDGVARRGVADALGARFEFGFTFRAHGRAGDLRAMLDVLADGLASPAFANDDVERVRGEARDRARDPTPGEIAERTFERLLLQRGDPALREPSDASLRAISIEDLRAYARRFVRPDLTTLAIVGDVDPAAVRADVEATFGEWAAAPPTPDVRSRPYAIAHAAKRVVKAERKRVEARFGFPAPGRDSRDYYALAVLQQILAARRYAPSAATLDADRFRGLLQLRLAAAPAQFPRAVAALRRELERLQRTAIGASELRRAQSKAVAEPLVAEQSTATIAERVREIGLDRLPLDVESKLPAHFAAVRANDVSRIARTYLHPHALIEVDEGTHP